MISCYLDQWYGTVSRNQLWFQMYPKFAWITKMDDMDFVHYQSFNPITSVFEITFHYIVLNRKVDTPLEKAPIISCTKITRKSLLLPTFPHFENLSRHWIAKSRAKKMCFLKSMRIERIFNWFLLPLKSIMATSKVVVTITHGGLNSCPHIFTSLCWNNGIHLKLKLALDFAI